MKINTKTLLPAVVNGVVFGELVRGMTQLAESEMGTCAVFGAGIN